MGNLANLRPFPPGVSGNPGGKPAAARNRLQGDFLNTLAEDFGAHGKEAIRRARERNPLGYVRAVVSLMPKQFEASDPARMDDDAVLASIQEVLVARQAKEKEAGESGD